MSNPTNLRILVIDDNLEIHKDFIKILTKDLSVQPELADFEKKILLSISDKEVFTRSTTNNILYNI